MPRRLQALVRFYYDSVASMLQNRILIFLRMWIILKDNGKDDFKESDLWYKNWVLRSFTWRNGAE
jgi:hypothetical protein